MNDVLRKALEFLEGCDPSMTSGGHKNQPLREEIRARLSQAGAGGGVVDGWKIVPIEPDELQIEAMRDAFRQARRGGVCGMTIDAQWRRENAPELAAYSAALTAAPTPPATPVQPTASVEAVAILRDLVETLQVRGKMMTVSHDDLWALEKRAREALASLTPAPTQGDGVPLTPKQRVMAELDRRLAAKSTPSPAPVSAPVSAPSPAGGVREALDAADRLEALAFSKQMSQRPLDYEQVQTIFKAVSTVRAALSSEQSGSQDKCGFPFCSCAKKGVCAHAEAALSSPATPEVEWNPPRPDVEPPPRTLATPSPVSAPATDGEVVDEIMTRVYRRFKGWSKRKFTADDVTWCEVRADILAIIASLSTPAPGHTDLMVSPESIDAFLEANPSPAPGHGEAVPVACSNDNPEEKN